jgi:NAD(P)-dependent dehydrogenase (short-subunit alcohol dehydrogenase family)
MAFALVTGANRGVGLALCRALAARGDVVLAACRKISPELAELPVNILDGVDLEVRAVTEWVRAAVGKMPLDLLIHAARARDVDELATFTAASLRRCYEVNAVAPLVLTRALVGCLASPARITFVSHGADHGYAYRMSQQALRGAAASLADELRARKAYVSVVDPGAEPLTPEALLARIDMPTNR